MQEYGLYQLLPKAKEILPLQGLVTPFTRHIGRVGLERGDGRRLRGDNERENVCVRQGTGYDRRLQSAVEARDRYTDPPFKREAGMLRWR